MTVYKCQTGPGALLKDNVTELRKQKRKIMEGDFYKCEEVAFSEDVSSRPATAALIARAASTSPCQMDLYFLYLLKAKWQLPSCIYMEEEYTT